VSTVTMYVRSPPHDGSLGAALPLIADVLRHVVQVASKLQADTSAVHAAVVPLPMAVGIVVAAPLLLGASVELVLEGATLLVLEGATLLLAGDGAGVVNVLLLLGETVMTGAALGATLTVAALGATLTVAGEGAAVLGVLGTVAGLGAAVETPVAVGELLGVLATGRAAKAQLPS
jgi:hypothetical protein